MPKRLSIAEHEYGGKKYGPGDPVEVLPEHCHLLVALQRIKPEEGEPGYPTTSCAELSAKTISQALSDAPATPVQTATPATRRAPRAPRKASA